MLLSNISNFFGDYFLLPTVLRICTCPTPTDKIQHDIQNLHDEIMIFVFFPKRLFLSNT